MEKSSVGARPVLRSTLASHSGRRPSWAAVREQVLHCEFYRKVCAPTSLERLEGVTAKYVSHIGDNGTLPPSPFLCVLVRYADCKPSPQQAARHIEQEQNVYWRALAATWLRWTQTKAEQIYRLLDPLLGDYRPITIRESDGALRISHLDIYIDQLLRYRSTFRALEGPFPVSVIPFPYLISRYELEARGALLQRHYAVAETASGTHKES